MTAVLGDVVDLSVGYAFKSSGFTDEPEGVRLLRGDNVGQGRLRWESAKRWPASDLEGLDRYLLVEGDVILAMDRPWITGGLKQARVRRDDVPSALVQRVARLRARTGLDQGYLAAVVASRDFEDHILSVTTGSAVPHISGAQILAFRLPRLPPEAEQRQIAATVAALDDKIQSNQRKVVVSHELAASLCQSILGSPTERWTDAWPELRLDDVLSTLEVGKRPAGGIKPEPDGIPSIGAESIVQAGSFDFSKTKKVSSKFFASMRRGHLEHLDVLLYKDGGTPGNFIPHVSAVGHGFPFSRAAINEHVYRLRIAAPYSQSFLYFWLSSPRLLSEMRRRGTGAAIPGLNSSAVRDLPAIQPPPQLLSKLQDSLDPMLDLILRSAKESRACTELRDALLPELLSGRIRVPEASEAVDHVLA